MIRLRENDEVEIPLVDFDPDVPIAITWPQYYHVLDIPLLVRLTEGAGLLEAKFDPLSGELIEVVLVNSPVVSRVDGSFSPVAQEDRVNAYVRPEVAMTSAGILRVSAYRDTLVVQISMAGPVRWHRLGRVLLGEGESGDLVGLAVYWNNDERDLVLSQ